MSASSIPGMSCFSWLVSISSATSAIPAAVPVSRCDTLVMVHDWVSVIESVAVSSSVKLCWLGETWPVNFLNTKKKKNHNIQTLSTKLQNYWTMIWKQTRCKVCKSTKHWLPEDSFPIKCIFSSYLNLKTTPNFVHVQSQVCRFYYDADSLIISALSVRSRKRSRLQHWPLHYVFGCDSAEFIQETYENKNNIYLNRISVGDISYLMYAGSSFLVRCSNISNVLTRRGCVVFSRCSFLLLAAMSCKRNLLFKNKFKKQKQLSFEIQHWVLTIGWFIALIIISIFVIFLEKKNHLNFFFLLRFKLGVVNQC